MVVETLAIAEEETMAALKDAEIKVRTTSRLKRDAMEVYSYWGINLSDAVNIFLTKSVEAGGLPFELRADATGRGTDGRNGVEGEVAEKHL